MSKAEFVEDVLSLARKNRWTKLGRVIEGGEDRFGSTYAAICALDNNDGATKVLFHDAVRPFVKASVISACIEQLDKYSAVDVVIPTADTIVEVAEDGTLGHIPVRAKLRRGQTPQGFKLGALRAAYQRAITAERREFTCDCGVFREMMPDLAIGLVEGCTSNMKVTHTEDLFLADKLFQSRGDGEAMLREVEGLNERLRGTTLVVFGGSYGIGESIVEGARRLGANVFSFSRATTGTDVSDRAAVASALAGVHRETGRIDGVANTAALLIRKPLETTSDEEINSLIGVNLTGSINIAIESHKYLKESRGSWCTS